MHRIMTDQQMVQQLVGGGTSLYLIPLLLLPILVLAFSKTARSKAFSVVWLWSAEMKCDLALASRKQQLVDDHRSKIKGKVLDVGTGGGAQLKYLAQVEDVSEIVCVEPNTDFKKRLESRVLELLEERRRSGGKKLSISTFYGTVEEYFAAPESSAAANTFDCVACLLVLCTVPDPAAIVTQLHDLCLRPSGTLLFVEHVAPKDGTLLRSVFRYAQPCWNLCGDGCQLNRNTEETIRGAADWEETISDPYVAKMLPIPIPWIFGVATKKAVVKRRR